MMTRTDDTSGCIPFTDLNIMSVLAEAVRHDYDRLSQLDNGTTDVVS